MRCAGRGGSGSGRSRKPRGMFSPSRGFNGWPSLLSISYWLGIAMSLFVPLGVIPLPPEHRSDDHCASRSMHLMIGFFCDPGPCLPLSSEPLALTISLLSIAHLTGSRPCVCGVRSDCSPGRLRDSVCSGGGMSQVAACHRASSDLVTVNECTSNACCCSGCARAARSNPRP